jgi:ABC-type phosphate/phosphonate transport system substrate-binding protein
MRELEAFDDSPTDRFVRATPGQLRVGAVFTRGRVDGRVLGASLESALDRPVKLTRFTTYGDLAAAVMGGLVELAWLPPAVYLRARNTPGVRLVAMLERSGADAYRSALLGRSGRVESIARVRGARAAWVDPWSAAGYLMPRGVLASHGIDPSTALASERFCGTYDAAIDAVTVGNADLTAAFCTVDASGKLIERGWSEAAPVRVLEISPPIPSDVLCATASLSAFDAAGIESKLGGRAGAGVAGALGGTGLARPDAARYDALERALLRRAS